MYRAAVAVAFLSASQVFGQDVFLIHGRVLREDLTPFNQPINLSVVARRSGDPLPIQGTVNGSDYEVRIPARRAQDASIWTIEFSEDTRHPGSLTDISGPVSGKSPQNAFVHQVDKVLLPENGPHGYQRNIEQLLEYERIWYDRVAAGIPVAALKQQYERKLLQLPTILNTADIPEIAAATSLARTRRQLLWRKRSEVFRLYRVQLPGLQRQKRCTKALSSCGRRSFLARYTRRS